VTREGYLNAFRVVVALGIPPNLYFAYPALFKPDFIVRKAGLKPGFETVWLRNAGLLIWIITAYYLIAIWDPERYEPVAWMTIVGRLSAGVYWVYVSREPEGVTTNGAGFRPFVFVDFAFGLVSAVLLYLGLHT
jgi:hypothetical protein